MHRHEGGSVGVSMRVHLCDIGEGTTEVSGRRRKGLTWKNISQISSSFSISTRSVSPFCLGMMRVLMLKLLPSADRLPPRSPIVSMLRFVLLMHSLHHIARAQVPKYASMARGPSHLYLIQFRTISAWMLCICLMCVLIAHKPS